MKKIILVSKYIAVIALYGSVAFMIIRVLAIISNIKQ